VRLHDGARCLRFHLLRRGDAKEVLIIAQHPFWKMDFLDGNFQV
jgi:hypothetical protein